MKKIGITLCLLALLIFTANAQEVSKKEDKKSENKKVEIRVKDGEAQPMIIIDGKEYDFELLELIDKDKIESVAVLKGEKARSEYGEDAVIIITTKRADQDINKVVIRKKESVRIDINSDDQTPVIEIDGEIKDKEAFESISPDDILSVEVLKDEKSMLKYNTSVGVIRIKTKSKKK